MLNWIVWNRTIFIKMDLALITYKGWYAIKPNQPSDCLVSYPEYSLGKGSYPCAKMQLVYSTLPADWQKSKLWLCWTINCKLSMLFGEGDHTEIRKRKERKGEVVIRDKFE